MDTNEYLLHLSRYLHLNPVLAGLVAAPEDWEFSSYREYVGSRDGTLPATDPVLAQFREPAQYREFVESEDLYYDIQSAGKFLDSLEGISGIYGEGDPLCVNTYNGEDLLSQTIQYFYWTDDNGPHVLLQIHGGCDVRGGYTVPVAFDCDENIFENAKATIYCEDCNQYWDTDDGSHWYPDGCCGNGYQELQTYPATDDQPEYPDQPHPDQKLLFDMQPSKPNAGVLWIDDNDKGHCPHCGGILRI